MELLKFEIRLQISNRRFWVLKIIILPLIFFPYGSFQPKKFGFSDELLSTMRTFF